MRVKVDRRVEGVAPFILKLGFRWKWAVNFTHLQLYPGKEPRRSLIRKLGVTLGLGD